MSVVIGKSVLNTYSLSDLSISGGKLFVDGTVSGNFSPITFNQIVSANVGTSILGNPYAASVAFTPANNTRYEFTITQYGVQFGLPVVLNIAYTSDASGTASEIATALVNAINASGFRGTATGSGSPVTITADDEFPNFAITAISNVTVTNGMATFAPNGTASLAITNVIAPNGTAATAIAGTTTVTVTTLAAHGLAPGDEVTIASAATFLMSYTQDGKVFVNQTGVTAKVATVPTSTTFTLEGVTGNGATNSGTITITTTNIAFVQTNAANTLAVGDFVSIAGVATATLNGGTSGTFRVESTPSTTRFKIGSVLSPAALVGTNSGTITITLVASLETYSGDLLIADGVTDAISGDFYTAVSFYYGQEQTALLGTLRNGEASQVLFVNEGDSDYGVFIYALIKALQGYLVPSSDLANASLIAKI